MSFGSRISQSREPTLRDNYSSNNQPRTPNHRLDEIRRKYDTPTRKDIKDVQNRAPLHNNDNKLCFQNGLNDKWGLKETFSRELVPSPTYHKENIKSEEEAVLRKIKQMKQTIKNKNNQDKIKTTKSIYEPRLNQKIDPKCYQINENRVESIDKINNKIQHILSCLKENQNRSISIFESEQRVTDILNNSKITVEATKSISRTTAGEYKGLDQSRKERIPEFRNIQDPKTTISVYKNEKKYGLESPISRPVTNFDISSNAKNMERSQSKSFIYSGPQNIQKKYEMKSGKKLDDEITKIQSKIQQFEEEKKKLNIDFKPYSYSNSKSTSNLSKRSCTIDRVHKPITKQSSNNQIDPHKNANGSYTRADRSFTYNRNSFEPNSGRRYAERLGSEKTLETSQINVSISNATEKPTTQQENSLFKIKLIPIQAQVKNSSSRVLQNTNMLSEELKNKTNEGIQDRKKKLNYQTIPGSRLTVKKLVEKLSSQVDLDEKFRNLKLWFECNMECSKWETLQEKLKKKTIFLNKQTMKNLFKISDQQNNPFFSVREIQGDIDLLISSYIASEQNWKRQLYKKFNREDFKKEDFTQNSVDLQRKGNIVIEDVVRFLNMETGTFYRNRDIYLIFKRIKEQAKISFCDFVDTFCN